MNAIHDPPTPDSEVNISSGDVMRAVRESAMLADVTLSVWSGERSDRKLMDKVKADNGAVGNVGKLVKNLLAGADDKLKDTRSAFAAVRSLHYSLTLPWTSDPHAERQRGPRLLPTLLFQRYITSLSAQKRKAVALLDEFIDEYPAAIAKAQANLGAMVVLADYPSVDEVRAAFRVAFDFEPIPAGTDFKGLPGHALERLSKGLQTKQEHMVAAAQRAMWEQVRSRVEHLAARLADQDATFKTSTVEHVRELVALLPGWNVAGSEHVSEVARDIERMLDGVTAETLRDNASARSQVAQSAQAVVERMKGWGL